MILKIRKNRPTWAVFNWLRGLDFFAQIRHVCSHLALRKRSFSQSQPLKTPMLRHFCHHETVVVAASSPSEQQPKSEEATRLN
jgi:hypothetical protein